jgi:Protein of unknown function (DUF1475)
MTARTALRLLFATILAVMLFVTLQASLHQPVWAWRGLVAGPDRWWTIATLADAYCGFLTFYAWVFYKERTAAGRTGWFVAIMLLGNFAMACYALLQLSRLRADQPLEQLLLRAPAPSR